MNVTSTFTVEERAKAREKVVKLLALAANHAATEAEKDTALQMARKLAAKYSFRIMEPGERMDIGNISKADGTPKYEEHSYNDFAKRYAEQKTEKYKAYKVKSYDRKFIEWILSGLGYHFVTFDDCFQVKGEFDIDSFSAYYKEIRKLYDVALSAEKLRSYGWSRTTSKEFKKFFSYGLRHGAEGKYNDIFTRVPGYEVGFDCGKKFQSLRKEGR